MKEMPQAKREVVIPRAWAMRRGVGRAFSNIFDRWLVRWMGGCGCWFLEVWLVFGLGIECDGGLLPRYV